MEEREYFLAQYNQVWQQRRQHVTLVWAIPTALLSFLAIFSALFFGDNKSNGIELNWVRISALLPMVFGLCGLFFRHDFFIRVLGLLLQDLNKARGPLILPQFGNEFRNKYKDRLNFLERVGSLRTGTFWWFAAFLGLSLFVLSAACDSARVGLAVMLIGVVSTAWIVISTAGVYFKEWPIEKSKTKGVEMASQSNWFFDFINNSTVQNFFKITTGIVVAIALVISIQTFQRSVVFGNRPLPKIELKQAQDGVFKIELSNKGKDPLTDTRLLYKFAPVGGNRPVEERVKRGKFCANLIEQESPPVVADTRLKIDDLQFENRNIFFFIGIYTQSLYGEKSRFETYYTTIDDGNVRVHPLNGNYGSLGPEHRAMVKAQEEELKRQIMRQQSFYDFCIDEAV